MGDDDYVDHVVAQVALVPLVDRDTDPRHPFVFPLSTTGATALSASDANNTTTLYIR